MGNPKVLSLKFTARGRFVGRRDGTLPLTDSFDEQPGFVEWNADGIYFNAAQRTAAPFSARPGKRKDHSRDLA